MRKARLPKSLTAYVPSLITLRDTVGGQPWTAVATTRTPIAGFDRPGFAADFSAAGAKVTLLSGLVSLNQGTVAMWARPTFANGAVATSYWFDSDLTRHAFFHESGVGLQMYNDARITKFVSASWTVNQPNHFAFVYEKTSNTQTLYLNGVSQTGSSISGVWGSTALGTNAYVGSRFNTTENFNGCLWGVQIYPQPLAASDVWRLYTMGPQFVDRLRFRGLDTGSGFAFGNALSGNGFLNTLNALRPRIWAPGRAR